MTAQEKLTELLEEAAMKMDCPQMNEVADYLLANGVIVTPCKVEKYLLKENGEIVPLCKQNEGEWEIVKGSNGQEKMVCTNCRHGQDLHSTFTYCPNCGARMHGSKMKGGGE